MHRVKRCFKDLDLPYIDEYQSSFAKSGRRRMAASGPGSVKPLADQNPPGTESASTARWLTKSKNAVDCPRKSKSPVNALIVATAPPFLVVVGRMTEHAGKVLLMKVQGSGRVRLV